MMEHRGILTDGDRELLRGEDDYDADDPKRAQRMRERRHYIRQRIENLEDDLEILEEAGEEDLLETFYDAIDCESSELEARVQRLENEVLSE